MRKTPEEREKRISQELLSKLRSGQNRQIGDAVRALLDKCESELLQLLKSTGGLAQDLSDLQQDTIIVFLNQLNARDTSWEPELPLWIYFYDTAKKIREQQVKRDFVSQRNRVPYEDDYDLLVEKWGLDKFFDPYDVWKEPTSIITRDQIVTDAFIDRLNYVLKQLSDKDKRDSFLKKVLSNPKTSDDFDSRLNELIRKVYSLAKEHDQHKLAEQGRTQLIENADQYTLSIAPKIRGIIAGGAATLEEVATALNESGITTKNGNDWHASGIKLQLERINKLEPDQPVVLNKHAFLNKIEAEIEQVRQAGANNNLAIANALNERNIPSKGGKQWYATTVKLILQKLEESKRSRSNRKR